MLPNYNRARQAQPEGGAGTPVASFWAAQADRYDRAYDGRGGGGLRARHAIVLALLGGRPGDVVDAGMGPGRLLADLAARGWRVAGADISPAMVQAATRRLPGAAPLLRQGSIERLPFEDATFDAAVATGVLEYVDFRVAALRELARVLRPGGIAVVSVPNRFAPREALRWAVVHPLARSLKRMIPLGRPPPPPRRLPPSRKRFGGALAASGLEPRATVAVGDGPAPAQLVFVACKPAT